MAMLAQQGLRSVDASVKRVSPFVKWAGGKGSLLRRLMPYVPASMTSYYEPFLGGGALFLSICGRGTPFSAFLSDINSELVETFSVVKDTPHELLRYLHRLQRQFSSAIDKTGYYYTIRDWKPTNRVESAARFIFLNKTCYNGLYRVNRHGKFNVPFGHYKNARIFAEDNILAVSHSLSGTSACLRTVDYRTATSGCGENDFVYLDPPYYPTSRTAAFTDYTSSGFTQENQEEVAELFDELVDRGCVVLLTNSDTVYTRKLYRKYRMKTVDVWRPISCIGNKRRGFKELVVFSGKNFLS